jgi:molybdopterin synthase sulfur carrier subunit
MDADMKVKLACGRDSLAPPEAAATGMRLADLLASFRERRPDLFETWCDEDGRLRETLPAFVNGEHIRFREGLQTELKDGDEVYIIPLIAGG